MRDEIIAVVAGKEITNEEFETFVQNLPQDQKAYLSYPGFREQLLEQYLSLHTFARDALEKGLDQTEEFAKILENTRRDILAQLAMRDAISGVTVSPEEAKEYYDANPNKFRTEEKVQARHILVDDEARCREILERITSQAETFEDAARAYSTCPSKERGGDLGE